MGCKLLVVACGIQFPNQGLNLGPLHWDPGVLATGPPGKSPTLVLVSSLLFKLIFFNVYHFSNKSHKNINKKIASFDIKVSWKYPFDCLTNEHSKKFKI